MRRLGGTVPKFPESLVGNANRAFADLLLGREVPIGLTQAVHLGLDAVVAWCEESMSKLPCGSGEKPRGHGDTKRGQKRRRLSDEANSCLAAYNRLVDRGKPPDSMKQHCRDFAEKTGGSADSLYRTLKDYSDLWHKPKTGDKTGDSGV